MNLEERKKILSKFNHIFNEEKAYYSKKRDFQLDYDLEKEQFFQKANLKLKMLLGSIKGKKILDVGCGKGSLSFFLAQKGANVIGIDLSSNFIEFCKEEAKNLGFSIDFKEMNAQIPDFEDNTFDIIVGSRVIHHMPDVKLFFKECKRILKRRGFITFVEPLKKNPIVELNRKYFAPKSRTSHEHPLFLSDVKYAEEIYENIEHYEFFLLSPFAMFFKNFINIPAFFKVIYKTINFFEKPLYKIEYLKEFCWQIVFKSVKL
ncbi:hypothetical protein LCGC14_0973160 [marine sediment metagenome]|uniref:Methyltransferase type 11 domain-containing protein n=1 Tax=marine sediment metagenome TaxID=412755 RepID=A0A0F9NX63_9ZZZZ|nr:MAG: SAM-dependent methyltransferase [Candidatus Lokiarchaeum sp. GC14_75]